MRPIDVMSVGDAATDVFIRLIKGCFDVRHDERGRWLQFPFGEKVPFDCARTVEAGGNAANAAVGFARLGLSTALVAHVGSDQIGRDMQAALHREGIDTRFMRFDPGTASNRKFVLWAGEDRTILVRHEIYDYHWAHLRPKEVPRWIYLSSVGSDAVEYYGQLAEWLSSEPAVNFAFQPGTFQIAQGPEVLGMLYRRAQVLICNREEAAELDGGDHGDVPDLLNRLHRLGPRTVVVTDGPAGAFASDGVRQFSVPAYPDPSPPMERTGAGDAFASTLVGALAKGHPLEVALAWAPVNAMSVVQNVGSQTGLLREEDLVHLVECAPASYAIDRS